MLDILGLGILALSFYRGWRKGIVVAATSLLAIVVGTMAALKLSGALALWMQSRGWVTGPAAPIVAYVVLFIGVLWMVRFLAKNVEALLKLAMLGIVNRGIGGLLYAFIGAFIWSCLLWIGTEAKIITPETLATSQTYQWFAPLAPWVFAHIGAVLPFAKNLFSDLSRFFDNVNQHLPASHVGAH